MEVGNKFGGQFHLYVNPGHQACAASAFLTSEHREKAGVWEEFAPFLAPFGWFGTVCFTVARGVDCSSSGHLDRILITGGLWRELPHSKNLAHLSDLFSSVQPAYRPLSLQTTARLAYLIGECPCCCL